MAMLNNQMVYIMIVCLFRETTSQTCLFRGCHPQKVFFLKAWVLKKPPPRFSDVFFFYREDNDKPWLIRQLTLISYLFVIVFFGHFLILFRQSQPMFLLHYLPSRHDKNTFAFWFEDFEVLEDAQGPILADMFDDGWCGLFIRCSVYSVCVYVCIYIYIMHILYAAKEAQHVICCMQIYTNAEYTHRVN